MKIIAYIFLLLGTVLSVQAQTIVGAWELKTGQHNVVILATENYLTYTLYQAEPAEFHSTWGGPYKFNGNELSIDVEFNSEDTKEVGEKKELSVVLESEKMMNLAGQSFKRIDYNTETPLAAGWQITKRATSAGEMQPMKRGARKTLKILTGTRFQWIAMNTESGEFSGTGGGTYTLKNGTYTEQIKFFSRDNSRVGASLSFGAEVNEVDWIHSGKSSKGDPIKEVWSKIGRD